MAKKKPEKKVETKEEEKSFFDSAQKEKKLKIALKATVDNIVFSDKEIYAFYKISNNVFDFLSNDQKVSLGLRLTNAFNNLMGDNEEPVNGMLITTSVPIDVDAWAAQLTDLAHELNKPGPGFEKFVNNQTMYLENEEFMKKVTYLGVCIGKRGALNMDGLNVFESGFKSAFETLEEWLRKSFKTPSAAISASEEDFARKKERTLHTTLSTGNLQAERATSEEILLMFKRQFYPAMPAPYLDIDPDNRLGTGDLDLELGSVIENKYRWLKITQMIGDQEVSGYRATLTFAKFPKEMYYPMTPPFMYFPAQLGAAFTSYVRFTMHPTKKIKGELAKKALEHEDELENIRNSMAGKQNYSIPSEVAQSLEDLQVIENMIAQDKTAWIEASYRIVVEAVSEERLKEFCAILKQRYDDLGILLRWTAGDQKELFLEQMPGDTLRVKSFNQTTNLNMLSTAGMNFSSDIGDPIHGTIN